MKRFVHGLLVALLIVGSATGKTYSNKTFLMPRSNGMNMAMEYTTWHKQTAVIDDDKFGASIQLTGFYEESDNKTDLGQYFGVRNFNNDGCCVNDFLTVVPDWSSSPNPKHIAAGNMFHAPNNLASPPLTLADKLVWRPTREAYGLRIDYHQKLDMITDGLFLKVSVPIVHVKTSMGWTSTCGSCATSCDAVTYCAKQNLEVSTALTGTSYSVADYLTGCVSNNDASAKQVALCKGKIHNGKSETGVADIDVILGYNFLYKQTRYANVSAAVTIPVGNTPDAEWLWEPVVGNAGHWAIGFGMDAKFQIWSKKKMSLDFLTAFNYRYLLNSTEKRIMGFRWPNGAWAGQRAMYGHWYLGAKKGDTTTTPMANFLARDLRVTPGSHYDGITQFTFNYNNFSLDAGFNTFYKRAENVRMKEDPCSCEPCGTCCTGNPNYWYNDTFAVAAKNWDADSNPFSAADYTDTYFTGWINRSDLCLDVCTNPSVLTYKLYGGLGYAFNKWEYPLMLGLGGSYEWETDNDSLRTWALWAKVGLRF